jgi:Mce-associated membrane protein
MSAPSEADAGRRRWTVICLAVLSVALVVTGVAFLVRAHTLDDAATVTNHAVTDRAVTAQVIGQVSTGLDQVLSYDYAKPQVAKQAAARWLGGDAPKQYALLVSQLQKLAPGQQLSLVAKVVTAGVTVLHGNTAQLLVFVDQQSTRASDHQSSLSAAQVEVTATKHGGSWKITELEPL